MQQETIVHIVSILNVTRYATQVNRQHINIVMDAIDKMVQDVNNIYNITTLLYTSLSYHQLVLQIRSVLVNPLGFAILYKLQEPFHPTSYQLKILNRCYHTLRRHYLLPCIYQCHLKMPYTFIDTYILMF